MPKKLKLSVTYSRGDSKDSEKKTLTKSFDFEDVTNPKSALREKFEEMELRLKKEIGQSYDNGQTSLEDE